MKRALLFGGALVALLVVETAFRSWFPGLPGIRVGLSLALGLSFLLSPRALLRVTLLAALASELGSALPLGLVGVTTLAAPHLLQGLLRRPRPDAPFLLRFAAAAILLLAVQSVLHLALDQVGAMPPGLFPAFLGRALLLPVASGALLAAAITPLARHERSAPLLALLAPAPR